MARSDAASRDSRPSSPHTPPAVCRRASPRARSPPPAIRRMLHQRGLDLPGLDPETADLDLIVEPTNKVQHAVRPPASKIAGPVHPAPRCAERVRYETLRRQTGTDQDNPAPDRRPLCKAPRQRQPQPATNHRPTHKLAVRNRPANRKLAFAPRPRSSSSSVTCQCFGDAVHIR